MYRQTFFRAEKEVSVRITEQGPDDENLMTGNDVAVAATENIV